MDVERLRREMPEELPEDERPEELPEREDEALEPESPGDRPAGARPDRGRGTRLTANGREGVNLAPLAPVRRGQAVVVVSDGSMAVRAESGLDTCHRA